MALLKATAQSRFACFITLFCVLASGSLPCDASSTAPHDTAAKQPDSTDSTAADAGTTPVTQQPDHHPYDEAFLARRRLLRETATAAADTSSPQPPHRPPAQEPHPPAEPHPAPLLARQQLRDAAFDVALGRASPFSSMPTRAQYVLEDVLVDDIEPLPPLTAFLLAEEPEESRERLPALHVALNDAVAAHSARMQHCAAERMGKVDWEELRPGKNRDAAFEERVAGPCRRALDRLAEEWAKGAAPDGGRESESDRRPEAVALLRSHLERALRDFREWENEIDYLEPVIKSLGVGSGMSSASEAAEAYLRRKEVRDAARGILDVQASIRN